MSILGLAASLSSTSPVCSMIRTRQNEGRGDED
jgi:hypothetical protein